MMRRLFLIILVFGLSGKADAQGCSQISYLLTGYDNFQGTPPSLMDGALDLNWQIVQDPAGSAPYAPTVYDVPSGWADQDMQAEIGGNILPAGSLRALTPGNPLSFPGHEGGVYVYRTSFCLSGDSQDISMRLKFLADNQASAYLNGVLVAQHSSGMFINGHNVLVDVNLVDQSLFKKNIGSFTNENVLEIHVTNYGVGNVDAKFTPTGLTLYSKLSSGQGCSDITCSGIGVPSVCPCSSFQPEINKRYWVSAWVNVDESNQVKTYNPNEIGNGINLNPNTLPDVYLELDFLGSAQANQFFPTGEIIDSWQRIVGEFTVPAGTQVIGVNLFSDNVYDTYFDDIRIHPFNSSMKSYVYDGETFWLTSELDDNNYATFYEYDEEGGLIRIKKETERGIVTIQETRSNSPKKDNQ